MHAKYLNVCITDRNPSQNLNWYTFLMRTFYINKYIHRGKLYVSLAPILTHIFLLYAEYYLQYVI